MLAALLPFLDMTKRADSNAAASVWSVEIRTIEQHAARIIRTIQHQGRLDADVAYVISIATEQPDGDDEDGSGDDARVAYHVQWRGGNGACITRIKRSAEAAALSAFKYVLQQAGHPLVSKVHFPCRAERPGKKRVKSRRYLLDSVVLERMGFNLTSGEWASQRADADDNDEDYANDNAEDDGSRFEEEEERSENDAVDVEAEDSDVADEDGRTLAPAQPSSKRQRVETREIRSQAKMEKPHRAGKNDAVSGDVSDDECMKQDINDVTPSPSSPSSVPSPSLGMLLNMYHVLADKSPQGLLDWLRTLPSNWAQATLTSSVYNLVGLRTSAGYSAQRRVKYDICPDNMPEAEYQEWQIAVLNELYRITKADGVVLYNHSDRHLDQALFSPLEFILRSQWQHPHAKIVLARPTTGNTHSIIPQTHEYVYVLTKGGKHGPSRPRWDKSGSRVQYIGSVWRLQSSKQILRDGIDHPCPFDMHVVGALLRCANVPGDIVLDPFAGSGSTLLAAEALGCNFLGSDISDKYRSVWAARAEAQRARTKVQRDRSRV